MTEIVYMKLPEIFDKKVVIHAGHFSEKESFAYLHASEEARTNATNYHNNFSINLKHLNKLLLPENQINIPEDIQEKLVYPKEVIIKHSSLLED